jgi:hypothetical protein
MTKLSQKKPGSAQSRTNSKHWIGVEAEDIPQGWTDDMVKRLFDVLNREMIRLETEQTRLSDAKDRDGNPLPLDYEKAEERQKMLTRLRTDLERLRRMDVTVKSRKPQVTVSDDEERAELQREVDRIVAATETGKTDPGTAR